MRRCEDAICSCLPDRLSNTTIRWTKGGEPTRGALQVNSSGSGIRAWAVGEADLASLRWVRLSCRSARLGLLALISSGSSTLLAAEAEWESVRNKACPWGRATR